MNKCSLLFLPLLFLTACNAPSAADASFDVIPRPRRVEPAAGGEFVLRDDTKIVYPAGNPALARTAEQLAQHIRFTTGFSLKTSPGSDGRNAIVLDTMLNDSNREAYRLTVGPARIVINGASGVGTFYGMQTLRKALPADTTGSSIAFPAVEIDDAPRFPYRGMMLDVSRHFFPVEFVERYIDLLALHNINTFHWHLSDDQGWRIEIARYPELTGKGSIREETLVGPYREPFVYDGTPYGGYYTREQIERIVRYAADRYINVVPEIELPGHMLAALAAYPALGCTGGPYKLRTRWGVEEDVLCAGNEKIYEFLEGVFTEVMEMFPSKYIHIGGDECPKIRWEKCPRCQAKIRELGLLDDSRSSAETKLQSYVTTRMSDFFRRHGRTLIGWSEIVEGGLAPGATVMSWLGTRAAVEAARQGHDAIMTPTDYLYFDYYQSDDTANEPPAIGGYVPVEKVYSLEPVPAELTAAQAKHVIGVQANLWTEYIATGSHAEYMVLPRMDALCEVQWTMPENKDYTDFLRRLQRMVRLYDRYGYNYARHVTGKTE